MMRIGLFSQLARTTVKTLRHYDETGLLCPAHIDGETGYRYYTTAQLNRIHTIQGLRQIGLGLPEVREVLKGGRVEEVLQRRQADLMQQQRELSDQLSRINYLLTSEKEGLHMNYQATIKEIPPCTVYSKRMRVANYDTLFQVVPALGETMGRINPHVECAVPEYCFNIYHDGEYRERDIDVEFCEAVTSKGVEAEGIVFKDMPAVTVVSAMHRGPYATLGGAYAFLSEWIEQNGYAMAGKPRESYIDGIWNQEQEADWLTEVQMPVVKK